MHSLLKSHCLSRGESIAAEAITVPGESSRETTNIKVCTSNYVGNRAHSDATGCAHLLTCILQCGNDKGTVPGV